MNTVRLGACHVLTALVLATAPAFFTGFTPVYAQAPYPNKPIRFILPFPPGGGTDTLARILGTRLADGLAQPVTLDNRPGAGSNLGAEIAAKSPADGYTLLMGNIAHSINMTLYSKLNYNFIKDFNAVSLLASAPNIVVVHPSVPVKSVRELVALARARPGALDYASSGSGSSAHLAAVLMLEMTKTKMNHVPYKGGGPAVVALVSGEVSVGFATTPSVIGHIKSGRLRALAVTGAKRSAAAPELPTVSEAGIADYEMSGWYGILVPAGTPAGVITRLHAESLKVLKIPEVVERMAVAGFEPVGNSPAEFTAFIANEVDKWAKVVKAAGMRVD